MLICELKTLTMKNDGAVMKMAFDTWTFLHQLFDSLKVCQQLQEQLVKNFIFWRLYSANLSIIVELTMSMSLLTRKGTLARKNRSSMRRATASSRLNTRRCSAPLVLTLPTTVSLCKSDTDIATRVTLSPLPPCRENYPLTSSGSIVKSLDVLEEAKVGDDPL